MSQERDCNTCARHVQGRIPPHCVGCLTSSWDSPQAVRLPKWQPIKADILSGAVIRKVNGDAIAPLKKQVGGSHYTGLKIQPMEYSVANGLNACQHTAIKYITRKKGDKAKRLEDLDKAIHSLEMYKQFIVDGLLED